MADPDKDNFPNLMEYASGSNPKDPADSRFPTASMVTVNGQTFGAVSYSRAKAATDCSCEVIATTRLSSPQWQNLTTIHSIVDEGAFERITVRDTVPMTPSNQRFYRLQFRLN
jgi:hypothetical protein